jgi:hypothetical protein
MGPRTADETTPGAGRAEEITPEMGEQISVLIEYRSCQRKERGSRSEVRSSVFSRSIAVVYFKIKWLEKLKKYLQDPIFRSLTGMVGW